ncbi:rubredoxin [Litoribacillus peritrichatus]|uniref:Rubredoxin-like domain-containing protein n=1 Tax=Litoribacillus peritrichatus TaxID=718191 RepID=A0ABP7M9F2_9GAMM
MSRYQCPDCGYIYDETEGCEHEGYPAGTVWASIPDSFPCPDCFVREKPDFIPVESSKTNTK